MSIEHLLKPRYKVIAPYPENKDFPVGKIITFNTWPDSLHYSGYWQHIVEDSQGVRAWLSTFFDEYPHLFQPLPWWSDRAVEDMPEYVKLNPENTREADIIFKVVEVKQYSDCIGLAVSPSIYPEHDIIEERLAHTCAKYFIPATETEYQDYLKTKGG
jgi:hypothetical protein